MSGPCLFRAACLEFAAIVLVLLCSVQNALYAQNEYKIEADASKAVVLKPGLFGTATYANLAGKRINDPNLMEILHCVRPPTLRIPGGNAMNYWDWNAGLPKTYASLMAFVMNPSHGLSTFKSKARSHSRQREQILAVNGPLTAERWFQLAREGGSKIIWGLNLSTSKPDETLEFMTYLKNKNITPEMVELGNELYFDTYECEMPSASYYVQQAKKHAGMVRKIFPNAKIAVPVYANKARVSPDPASVDLSSIRSWNETLNADQSFYDAVVIHIYFRPFNNFELGSSTEPARDQIVRWGAVRSSINTMKSLMNWVEKYWPGKEIWMTEWALNNAKSFVPRKFGRKYLVQHTVFSGLFNANVILNTACFKSAVTSANFWQIYGDDTFGMISSRGIKRPSYYVFQFLCDAVHTAHKIERMDINNVPVAKGPGRFSALSAPLLDAYAFLDATGKVTHYAFVNKMDLGVKMSLGGYEANGQGIREYFAPAPNSELLPDWGNANNPPDDGAWAPPLSLAKDIVNLSSFTIPKWSFSVVRVR
jgi:hypothetical protein